VNSSHHRARSLVGAGLVLASATLFAVNGTVSKLALQSGLSALRLVEIRCLAAAAVFALVAAARDPASLLIGRRELAFVAGYGVVGLAMVQWLYFVAILRMPVSVSLLIEFTAPVLVALWVRYVRREPVHQRIWGALGLIVAGLALVARVWAGLTLDGVGLLAASLAAVALATYYLLGERGLGTRDAYSLAAWSFGAAALFWSLLLPWWSFPFGRLGGSTAIGTGGPSVPVGALVVWVVLLGTVAPFGLALLGLERIGATRTGLVAAAEPPLAGLVAWGVLGETLSGVQLLGAVVVLSGILLAETVRAPHPVPGGPAGWRLSVGSARVAVPTAGDEAGDHEEAHQ
jgi:drug/metabolite transporter (DMT)-like permease